MRTIHRTLLLTLALGAVSSLPAAGQQTTAQQRTAHRRRRHETLAQLKAQAKITDEAARATALAQVPGGTVEKTELEREGGKLVYSVDVKVAGKPGVDELWVDALTGKVVKREHETPQQERAEKRKEAKEEAAKAKKP